MDPSKDTPISSGVKESYTVEKPNEMTNAINPKVSILRGTWPTYLKQSTAVATITMKYSRNTRRGLTMDGTDGVRPKSSERLSLKLM